VSGLRILARVAIVLLVATAIAAPNIAKDGGLLNYGPLHIDKTNLRWQAPGSTGDLGVHLLGTTKLGKDVAAGLVYGVRAALSISSLAVLIALLLGLPLGMMAGYYGDQHLHMVWWQWLLGMLCVLAALWYLYTGIEVGSWGDGLIGVGLLALSIFLMTRSSSGRRWTIPIDSLVMKVVEIRRSIPLIYILVVAGGLVQKHNYLTIALIIGCTCWTGIARHSRAYVMELRVASQHEALLSLSIPTWRIHTRHFLPQIWPQITVLAVFLASTAILLETSLSFLGLGLPSEMMTWGSLLSECREQPSAWWLAVCPGVMLTITLSALTVLGRSTGSTQKNQKVSPLAP
jgi:peptide/nickel transport system permease protein